MIYAGQPGENPRGRPLRGLKPRLRRASADTRPREPDFTGSLVLCGKDVNAVPRSPRRGCAWPGCPLLAEERSAYCAEHKRETNRQYNRYERAPDTGKKYGRAWRRIRERYFSSHPFCEKCFAEGRMIPAEEVHHITPVSRGGTHDEGNLMSLCRSCHEKIHHNKMGDR